MRCDLILLDFREGDLAHEELLAGVGGAILGLFCTLADLLAGHQIASAHESVDVVLEGGDVLLVAAVLALSVISLHLLGELLRQHAICQLLPPGLSVDDWVFGGTDGEDRD